MQRRSVLSFFLTNKTGAPHGDVLGRTSPLANSSSNCTLSSFISAGAILYGAFDIGLVPGSNSIGKSTSLNGGNPGKSSGNTSENSCTTALKEKYTSIASLGHDKQSILERFYGASVPEDVGVLPPNEVKTKGSGSRLQSRKEKAIREANKPPRRCSKCQQMTNHDARNCDKFTRIAEENITSKK